MYVDPGTIRRKGDRVTMLELIDYKTIQTVANTAFLSAKVHREFDCDGDRHRTLATTKLSGNMASLSPTHRRHPHGQFFIPPSLAPF